MKHQSNLWENLFFSITIFAFAMSLTACDKKDDESTANLSNEEVLAVLEGALSSGTQGINSEVNDAIFITQQYAQKAGNNAFCGQTIDSTATRNINNALIVASYTTTWNWSLSCNNLRLPTSIDFHRTTNGDYETARITSVDNANGDWTINNLLTSPSYTLTGSYTRQGNQTLKMPTTSRNSFTSTVNTTIHSLSVNKNTLRIESGTATFTLTGIGSASNSFSYEGNIVFNGNGSATVTINGQTFEIQL